jgi:hypothetical protein
MVKFGCGEVAERLKAPVLKTGIRETVSRVRIPPSPPFSKLRIRIRNAFFGHAALTLFAYVNTLA